MNSINHSSPAEQETLFDFPCNFPIKVMGLANTDLDILVVSLIRPHCPDLAEGSVTLRESSHGKYVSVTVMITAHNRAQLDAIYQTLSTHKAVLMVL